MNENSNINKHEPYSIEDISCITINIKRVIKRHRSTRMYYL